MAQDPPLWYCWMVKLRAPAPLVIAFTIVLAVVTAWALSVSPVLSRLESYVAGSIEHRLSPLLDGLDIEVSYQTASPRLLGSVTLGGLELRSGGVLMASATSASMQYRLSSLLSGTFRATRLRIEDLTIETSYTEAVMLVDRIASRFAPGRGSAGSSLAMQAGPAIELRRVNVRLGFDDGAWVEARVRAADLVLGEGGLLGASLAGTLLASDPLGRFRVKLMEVPFSASAAYDLDTREASLSANLAADSNLGRLSGIRLLANLDPSGIRASIVPRDGLERFEASWDAVSGQVSVEVACTRWSPRSFFSPGPDTASISPWLEARYSGAVSVSSDLSLGGSSMTVSLSGIIPLDLPGGRPLLTLAASGSWKSLTVDTATLRNEVLELGYSGELLPSTLGASGLLSAQYTVRAGLMAAADFNIVGSGSSWFAYAPAISIADAVVSDGAISVELDASSVSFYVEAALPYNEDASASVTIPLSLDALEPVTVSTASRLIIEGTTSLGNKPYLEATLRFGALRLDAFPLLLEQLVGHGGVPILKPLVIEGELAVYSDFTGLSYNSSGLLFVYEGPVNAFGVTSFSGGLGLLNVSAFDATVAGFSITGSASLDYGNTAGLGFNADLRLEDLPYSFSGTLMDGALAVTGDYGLRLTGRQEDGVISGRLDVVDLPVPLFDTVSFLSASTYARIASPEDWDVILNDLALTQPPGVAVLPSVSASGVFDESGGTFSRLTFVDRISALNGAADVTWALSDGFRVSTKLRMSGALGEYYVVDGEYRGGGGLDAVVSLRKAPLARLSIPSLRGVADADATVSGSVQEPVVRFNVTVNGGQRAAGLPFISGSGAYEGGTVTLTDSRARVGELNVSGLALRYDVTDADAELSADLSYSFQGNAFTGTLIASGGSINRTEAPSSMFDGYKASGLITEAHWFGGELDAIPVSVTRNSGVLILSAGEQDELRARLGSAGELSLVLAKSLPLSFIAEGRYADSAINLDVSNASVDIPFLFKLLNLPILRVESGTGTGSLRIRGKLLDPTVEGVVEFEDFYLSVPEYVSAPIGPILDPLYFTGRTMETSQAGVACGDATLVVSLESTLHQGIPDDIRLAIQTIGEALVPVSTRLLGLDIKGLARPDLIIEANTDRSTINGAIAMASGDITLTTELVNQQDSLSGGLDFTGSLDLSFGKAVKIFFPDKRLPVIYGQVDPSSRLAVTFDAARGDFSLKGNAMLRGGSVFYIQRNFYLRQATIEFNEDADQFDPKISLEAETRTSTGSGPVVVTLRAVDSRLSSLTFALESVPVLSEAVIQQLLGQQLLGGTSEGGVDLGRVIVENSDLIPTLNVASIFERNLQELLGLDLFVVRSQVFQRWLYDLSGLSALSGLPGETTLADFLEDTAIIGGKYIGDKLFLQAMITLVSDPLALTSSLSLDSDVSLEWKAPHFTLNWSIQPEKPDSLFIEDQSFSFSWRIPLQ